MEEEICELKPHLLTANRSGKAKNFGVPLSRSTHPPFPFHTFFSPLEAFSSSNFFFSSAYLTAQVFSAKSSATALSWVIKMLSKRMPFVIVHSSKPTPA